MQILALPTVNDTYVTWGKTKELSDTKLGHLKQIHSNYIQCDEWHELLQASS